MPTTDETALNAELSRAFQQLRAINISITTERQRGNVAGVQALLPLYRTWLDKYKAISAQLGQLEFTALDRFLLNTETYVDRAAQGLPDIGWGLGKMLLPFAVIAGVLLFFKSKLL